MNSKKKALKKRKKNKKKKNLTCFTAKVLKILAFSCAYSLLCPI